MNEKYGEAIIKSYIPDISYPDHVNICQGSLNYNNPEIQRCMPGFVPKIHNSILIKSPKLKFYEPNWTSIPTYGCYVKSFKLKSDANKVTLWSAGYKINEITNVKKNTWCDPFGVPVHVYFYGKGNGFLEIEWAENDDKNHTCKFLYIYTQKMPYANMNGYYYMNNNQQENEN